MRAMANLSNFRYICHFRHFRQNRYFLRGPCKNLIEFSLNLWQIFGTIAIFAVLAIFAKIATFQGAPSDVFEFLTNLWRIFAKVSIFIVAYISEHMTSRFTRDCILEQSKNTAVLHSNFRMANIMPTSYYILSLFTSDRQSS